MTYKLLLCSVLWSGQLLSSTGPSTLKSLHPFSTLPSLLACSLLFPPHAHTPTLDMLPSATAISIPTLPPPPPTSDIPPLMLMTSTLSTATILTASGAVVPATSLDADCAGQAMILSSALPPISTKVVAKIKSGLYVPMKNLLADMSLCT